MEQGKSSVRRLRNVLPALSIPRGKAQTRIWSEPPEPWDDTRAHKPWVVKSGDTVYHFYCAVREQGRLAKVIAAAKRVKPDILIFYHSCGFVEPLSPNLIDAGIDILNPVQPECMPFDKIHIEAYVATCKEFRTAGS